MGDCDFTCPACGHDYPTLARTARGTCVACGSAKKSAGSRKSMFLQREKYNRFTLSSMMRHRKKVLDLAPA